jgi:RNA polymerase sigma factor (sigma-70 family)
MSTAGPGGNRRRPFNEGAHVSSVTEGDEFSRLLDAASRGDERAWDRLLRDLIGPLRGYLRLRGAAEPDDLVNETLLRTARHLRRFRGDEEGFRSWVFTIAHHLLVDDRRRRRRRPAHVGLEAEMEGDASLPTAVDDLDSAWTLTDLRALVAQLTPDQRDVVLLRVVGGFSVAEVATIVGKEPNAIKQLQHRGVHSLRRMLEAARERERAADGEAAR